MPRNPHEAKQNSRFQHLLYVPNIICCLYRSAILSNSTPHLANSRFDTAANVWYSVNMVEILPPRRPSGLPTSESEILPSRKEKKVTGKRPRNELSPKQKIFAFEISRGKSLKEAAATAKVKYNTAKKWHIHPLVKAEIRRLTGDLIGEIRAQAIGMSQEVLEKAFEKAMNDQDGDQMQALRLLWQSTSPAIIERQSPVEQTPAPIDKPGEEEIEIGDEAEEILEDLFGSENESKIPNSENSEVAAEVAEMKKPHLEQGIWAENESGDEEWDGS